MNRPKGITRADALELIDTAVADADAMSALCIAWIGHDEFDGTLEETAAVLREYVDEIYNGGGLLERVTL